MLKALPLVSMLAICYNFLIMIKFYMQSNIQCNKFGCNIGNKKLPIVRMIAIRYIGSIELVVTYLHRVAIRVKA